MNEMACLSPIACLFSIQVVGCISALLFSAAILFGEAESLNVSIMMVSSCLIDCSNKRLNRYLRMCCVIN